MSNKIKRSDKYDFFKGTINNQKPKKTPKEKFKFGFKFVKIAFYVFLLSLSLTGCVQSIAIKSSSTTGSGIEFYRNEKDIAPFVKTYKIIERKDEGGKIIFRELVPDTKINYLVTNSGGTIEQLRNQANNGGKNLYGNYDNYSSSLRIVNSDDQLIQNTLNINQTSTSKIQLITGTQKPDDILFLNSSMLNEMNTSSSYSYNVVNNILKIPVFITKRPEIKPEKPEDLAQWESGYFLPNKSFQAYTQTGELVKIDENNEYVKQDENGKWIAYKEEEIDKFKYKFEFEKIYLPINLNDLYESGKFSRDYLQSIVNVVMQFEQFAELDNLPAQPSILTDKLPNQSITEKRLNKLDQIISDTLEPNPPVKPESPKINSGSGSLSFEVEKTNAKYTSAMKKAILLYQTNIKKLASDFGFSISKLNFSGESPDNWEGAKHDFVFGSKNKNSYNILMGGSLIGQKPIVTWGDAWGLGPFYGFVVYPISYIVNALVGSFPSSMGGGAALLAIVISVIAARMLTLLLTYKSVFAQAKQLTLAPKKAKIDAKYAAYKGNKQMEQKKRQETSELYKKNNINMLTPILSTLVSMPIFLSMWRIIQGIPFIKSTSIWGINFSQTSWRELFEGEWQYLALIVLAVIVQAGSQFLPRYLNKKRMKERSNVAEKEAMKKANRTQNIMMGIFVFMAVIFEAGVQIYWIVGGVWTMCQTLLIHHIQKTKIFKEKLIKYV